MRLNWTGHRYQFGAESQYGRRGRNRPRRIRGDRLSGTLGATFGQKNDIFGRSYSSPPGRNIAAAQAPGERLRKR